MRIANSCKQAILLLGCCFFISYAAALSIDSTSIDLPLCDHTAPGMVSGFSLGIVQPHASQDVLDYAARLTLEGPHSINICSESWASILPRWVPWAQALERGYGFVIFLLAFVAVVGLLYWRTPRAWWKRTTLIGILSITGLTWLLGIGILSGLHALGGQSFFYGTVVSLHLPRETKIEWLDISSARGLEAQLAQRQLLADFPKTADSDLVDVRTSSPQPTGAYLAIHRLNQREAPGTASARIATLDKGASVTFDGERQGDWWRVRTSNGQSGWVSSLWLRRQEELR